MNKEEWYKNRILWRANRGNMFRRRCSEFQTIEQAKKDQISNIVSDIRGEPILVFWLNEQEWTVLTTKEIISVFDGAIHRALLDEIEDKIKLLAPIGIDPKNVEKRDHHRMLLKNPNIEIRAPAGWEFFGLWGILKMFPLNVP